MKELEINIEYKKLHFDDLIYIFYSLKNATQKFYDNDEYWYDDKLCTYISNKIQIDKEDYYKSIAKIKQIIKKSISYEIIDFLPGSIKIKATFVISGTTLIPLITTLSLPAGMTMAVLVGLANLYYSEHEEEFDMKIRQLRGRWYRESEKRKDRGVVFHIAKNTKNPKI